MSRTLGLAAMFLCAGFAHANPPVANYIFPAGGQRGTSVAVKVGGLFLHDRCGIEMLGPGVTAPAELKRTHTLWIEGPLLPLPESQRQEDYPKDMAGTVRLAPDAPLGSRAWRVWTSQGVTPARRFVVGDLPEAIEKETEGDPIPERVTLPVTTNGRIFPHEDVDIWEFELRKGQTVTAFVEAARLGSPLDSRLEVRGPDGRLVGENDDAPGPDSFLRFTAVKDGVHQVKIHDINFKGSQSHVYRLTLTADPYVDRVFPLGARRGTRTSFQMVGQGVPNTVQAIDIPATATGAFSPQFLVGGKKTNGFSLDVDDLPEVVEDAVRRVTIPVVANGRIDKPGESDRWTFMARKGESMEVELRARALGSPLSGVVAVEDDKGKGLARAEAGAGNRSDPSLRFTAPADGTYTIVVSDQLPTRGGPDHAYRLRLSRPPESDFQLRFNLDALTVLRGGQVNLPVTVESVGGFRQPFTIQVEGLPADVSVTGTAVAAGQSAATLVFKAPSTAKVRTASLRIRGTAKLGEKMVVRTAGLLSDPTLDSVRLAVAVATPFKVVGKYEMGFASRGSVGKRRYSIERNGFDGPLTVSLADHQARHLQGATGPTITVPAGATEFEYPVTMPAWMDVGRTCRVCVMAVGVVKDTDGSTHTVSFNSVNQNEQYVVVIEAGQLELHLGQSSARAESGKSVAVPFQIIRGKGQEGPVRVELIVPAHVKGVVAPAVEVASTAMTGTLTIRFGGESPGPFNGSLTVRAILTGKAGPLTAEAKLDLGD